MNRSLNQVFLIGELVREPEMRYTPSGRPVTTFLLAASRSWITADGEKREETQHIHIVAFGPLAEECSQQLEKGCAVFLEGRLQSRRWEDRQGVKHDSSEIHLLNIHRLSESNGAHSTVDSDLVNIDLDEISF